MENYLLTNRQLSIKHRNGFEIKNIYWCSALDSTITVNYPDAAGDEMIKTDRSAAVGPNRRILFFLCVHVNLYFPVQLKYVENPKISPLPFQYNNHTGKCLVKKIIYKKIMSVTLKHDDVNPVIFNDVRKSSLVRIF